MYNKITLVIGGCRSGKSSHALYLANQISGSRKIFMATSVPMDQEMDARVVKHQKERGEGWITAEVPVDISAKIRALSLNHKVSINKKIDAAHKADKSDMEHKIEVEIEVAADVILVDCLTLWVSNLMFNNFDDDGILKMTQELQDALTSSSSPIFLVSNEVGMGIVPENALSRRFRDMAGMVNQKIAQRADQVIYMVAGIPMKIKPPALIIA